MKTAGAGVDIRPCGAVRAVNPLATAGEVLAVYAGILLYIWRWQDTHPYLWIPLLVVILLSHWVYHDTPGEMGLTGREFWPCARLSLLVLAGITLPAILYAVVSHASAGALVSPRVWLSLGAYLVWCSFQQYLTQSYFHRRIMRIARTPHLSSLVIALMFASAHIPNPLLMVATFAGGFIFAEIFIRHPNIWPLAFVQAVAGVLIASLSPEWIIHGMRVGPGYFLYHLR